VITHEQIQIKVAESLGWKSVRIEYETLFGYRLNQVSCAVPAYTESLDACREFEKDLTPAQKIEYITALWKLSPDSKIEQRLWNQDALAQAIWCWLCFATPLQRCEAWLRYKGVWE
jgi:hypothetical protein